jgi:ABC-type uncharacterized transport system YnjBCD permease subunit
MPNSKEIDSRDPKSPAALFQGIAQDVRRLVELEIKLVHLQAQRQLQRAERRLLAILLAFALLVPALYHLGDGISQWLYLYAGLDEWASKVIVSLLFMLPFVFLMIKRPKEN